MVGSREGGSWSILDLGVADAGMLEGGQDAGSGEQGETRDCVACDGLERRALSLEAPGKSLGVLDGRVCHSFLSFINKFYSFLLFCWMELRWVWLC
jgi:hypothetical protein